MTLKVAVASSREFYLSNHQTLDLCNELGQSLAESSIESIILITGGMTGVQESVARSFKLRADHIGGPRARQVIHMAPPGLDYELDFGEWKVVGDNFGDNRARIASAADIFIVVGGGPGTSALAKRAAASGKLVLCLRSTGGAAGGDFWMPRSLLSRPQWMAVSQWKKLGSLDSKVSVSAVVELCTLRFKAKL